MNLIDRIFPFKSKENNRSFDHKGKRALIITSSHRTLDKWNEKTQAFTKSKRKTGVHASEMTEAYYQFLDAGMQVDIASIRGGDIPFDPFSLWPLMRTSSDDRYLQDPDAIQKVKHSVAITEIAADDYDLFFIAGGWAAAYDLEQSDVLAQLITKAHASGKVIATVCHGALGLCNAKQTDGQLLVSGKEVTGVSNRQLKQLGIYFTPKHPETELKSRGAKYVKQSKWMEVFSHRITIDASAKLITAQNQKGAIAAAQAAMDLLI